MAEFFDMGGFGGYIWTSYGFAVICLGWLNYASWRNAKRAAAHLAKLQDTNRSISEKTDNRRSYPYHHRLTAIV